MLDLTGHRKEYTTRGLLESDAGTDPLLLFETWLSEALALDLPEPYAMTLATATPTGMPSARILLMRHFDERGLVFFSNYHSRKGEELAANPHGAMVFFWPEVERQVRVEGLVERVEAEESDAYHQLRPPESRLGSAASPQSRAIAHRDILEDMVAALRRQYPDGPPRPPHWGGYRLVPSTFEFWQGRPSRLHDRLRFWRDGDGWLRQRLAP